jgi:hypothetical protein
MFMFDLFRTLNGLADTIWKKYILLKIYVNKALICYVFHKKMQAGVDKLKFSVCDPLWNEGEEAIKSLHVRYRDSWNVTSE